MADVVPLHPDDEDTEDYSGRDSDLLPYEIFPVGSFWYWRIDHPKMRLDARVGPFLTAKAAKIDMMQWDKDDDSPAEIPDLLPGRITMGALDATAEKLVLKMLESDDPDEQAKARELFAKHSYD